MVDQVFSSLFGTLGGLIIGLLLLWAREWRRRAATQENARWMLAYLMDMLADKIEHGPEIFSYITPDPIIDKFNVIAKDEELRKAFETFESVYAHWVLGNYRSGGNRYDSRKDDADELKSLASQVRHREKGRICRWWARAGTR